MGEGKGREGKGDGGGGEGEEEGEVGEAKRGETGTLGNWEGEREKILGAGNRLKEITRNWKKRR